jgi:hypothetical protein
MPYLKTTVLEFKRNEKIEKQLADFLELSVIFKGRLFVDYLERLNIFLVKVVPKQLKAHIFEQPVINVNASHIRRNQHEL